jgi:hypothetical protein
MTNWVFVKVVYHGHSALSTIKFTIKVDNFDPGWVRRLGQFGQVCYRTIANRDLAGSAASLNECVFCWEAILPHTVGHATIKIDLKALLEYYQTRYAGAMYSGCGGGYLLVASEEPVPGSFHVRVRLR